MPTSRNVENVEIDPAKVHHWCAYSLLMAEICYRRFLGVIRQAKPISIFRTRESGFKFYEYIVRWDNQVHTRLAITPEEEHRMRGSLMLFDPRSGDLSFKPSHGHLAPTNRPAK
jgi:hypothetical protein